MSNKRTVLGSAALLLLTAAVVTGLWGRFTLGQTAPKVIELTQVPCQFLESENSVDHGFRSQQAADCERINAETGAARLAAARTIVLQPGRYIFRVTNRNVPYPLGFWLRAESLLARAILPSVSGGGLNAGSTRDYAIDLRPGTYVYSCPLNPTPDYKLVVRE